MKWGTVTITYQPTGYTQNYKRSGVETHEQCSQLVEAAVTDSVTRINVPGAVVNRTNIRQNLDNDPGTNYRQI